MNEFRTRRSTATHPITVHEDDNEQRSQYDEDSPDELDESRHPLEDSGCTRSASSDDEGEERIEDCVAEDMQKFEDSFKGINKRYRLLNRIGEGQRGSPSLPRGLLTLLPVKALSQRCIRRRISSTTTTETTGTSKGSGRHLAGKWYLTQNGLTLLQSRRST